MKFARKKDRWILTDVTDRELTHIVRKLPVKYVTKLLKSPKLNRLFVNFLETPVGQKLMKELQ